MKYDTDGDILIERLKIVLCCKNYTELATSLGISRSTLGVCRKSGTLTQDVREALRRKSVNPEWVEWETGPRFVTPVLRGNYHCQLSMRRLMDAAVRGFVSSWPHEREGVLH